MVSRLIFTGLQVVVHLAQVLQQLYVAVLVPRFFFGKGAAGWPSTGSFEFPSFGCL